MDNTFYTDVLGGNASQIFDDQDNVVWIDWGDEEDAIVRALGEYAGLGDLTAVTEDAENDYGYAITVTFGNRSLTIDPSDEFDSRHATLNAVDDLLPTHEIRFVTATNGSDTIAIAIETLSDWETLYNQFGRALNEHFCPVREIPDLMNTPGDEIDNACRNYANRVG